MYLSGKVILIAEAHLSPDVAKDLYWHWRIDDGLETVINQVNARGAGLVSGNLPTMQAVTLVSHWREGSKSVFKKWGCGPVNLRPGFQASVEAL